MITVDVLVKENNASHITIVTYDDIAVFSELKVLCEAEDNSKT